MENLKAQEEAIDSTPQAKADANKVIYGDIGLETLPSLPNLNSKDFKTTSDFVKYQQYKGEVEGPSITPGEFSSWDSDLDYGLRPGDDQNEVRAGNQDWAGELGTGLVKMGTEVTLGSLSSIALIPQTTAQFFGAQQDYSNSISEALDSYKTELNEKYGKTYVSAENAGFAPTSWEFWMDNSGNVATALSLMIPTWGFTKVLGVVSKALKIEQGLGKLAAVSKEASLLGKASKWSISRPGKEVLTGLAAASFSRNIESTMEASQTYKETIEALSVRDIHTGEVIGYKVNPKTGKEFTDAEATKIAGEAASSNYKKNWAMLAQDFLQYRHMFKGMDHARRAAQETVKKGLGKSALGFVGQAAMEGGEEGYQYISSKESIDTQLVEAGLKKESNWTDRYLKYAEDDEFKTSVLLGAVGASVMTAGGKALNAISPYISKEARENKELLDKAREAAESVQEAAEAAMTGDAVKFDTIKYNSFVDNVIGKAREGKLANLETELETMLNDTDESIEAQGHDPKEYRENVANALRIAKIGGENFNAALNDPTIADAVAPAYTRAKMYVQYAQDIQKTVGTSRTEAEQKDLEVFKLKEEETAAQMLELQKLVNSSSYATTPAEHAKAEELANNIVANSKGAYKSTAEVLNALDTVQVETYGKLRQQEAEIKAVEAQAKATVAALKTKEGQEEYLKDVAKARRAKRAASDLVDSGVIGEDSASTVAQGIVVAEEVIAAAKPDLNPAEVHAEAVEMVTATVAPKASGDTFKVGDIAVNARGKEHEVLEVDAEGNITKAKRIATSSDTAGPDIIITNVTHLAAFKKVVAPAEIIQPEEKGTATPAVEEVPAPVTDQISALFGPELTIEEATAKVVAQDEPKPTPPAHVLPQGEYETVNFEFSTWEPNPGWKNFGTTEKPNWRLVISEDSPLPAKVTPDPAIARITNGAGIDFKEAARPMQPGKTIPVFLRHNVLDNGKDSIGVFTADGRMISQLRMGPGFNSLMVQVKKSGNNLPAQIVKKYTSLGGSLANVTITSGAKYRRTLGEFFSVNSELLLNGEIFIGSSKDSNNIQFFGNKGSKEIKNFSAERIAEAAAKGTNELAGSTFMLMKDPNGQTVIVKLNETKVKDASVGGKTYADITNENIDKALVELQKEVDATIDPTWTPQQLEDYKKTGIGDLKSRFKEVAHEYVRLIEETNAKGKENANHFELNIGFAKGTNKLEVFMSVRDNTGKKVTSNSREAIATRLGDQFFDMSIAKMSNPEYVNKVVNNGFVMTDVYVERPWVNPQLTVRVGESSVVDMNNDAVEPVAEPVSDVVSEESIVTPKGVSTPAPKGFNLDALNIFELEEEVDSTSPVQLPNSNKGKEVTAEEVPGDINALDTKLTDSQKEDAIKNTKMKGC